MSRILLPLALLLCICGLSLAGCAGPPTPSDVGASDAGGPLLTRLIAPLSTATVTSQRPTLHWSRTAGADGARVEVCRDRACTMVLTTIDATGDSAAPADDLPAGVVFWRVRGATSAQSSATWQLTVGRRTAPGVDTSWGNTLDVNGDGYGDLAIGAPFHGNIGHVYVHLGSASGLGQDPATQLSDGTPASDYGVSVVSAGDLNGDGYADFAVGAPGFSSYRGRVYVHLGSASGLDPRPSITIDGIDAHADFGRLLAAAGDTNGDGYADLAIAAPSGLVGGDQHPPPHVYLYLGNASGLADMPAVTLDGPIGALAGAGDVNGDGYGDLAVGANNTNIQTGSAFVYLGSASGLATTPATTLSGSSPNVELGAVIACAGDVNGDGADLAIAQAGVAMFRAWLYQGSASGIDSMPINGFVDPDGDEARGGFGTSIDYAGDANGDGYADLVIGAPSSTSSSPLSRAHFYPGRAFAVDTTRGVALPAPDGADQFGNRVTGAGDVNGDGYADFAVAAPALGNGRVFVYLGSASGPGTEPTTTLIHSDGPTSAFGESLD